MALGMNPGSAFGLQTQLAQQSQNAALAGLPANASYSSKSSVGSGVPTGSSATINAQPINVNTMGTPYPGAPGAGTPSPGVPTSATGGTPTGGGASAGGMPQDMMTMYKNFLQDPSSATSNPMYKSMMDQGLQATERGMLAKGFQGSGNMATELQKTGMGMAGQYLPQMASMYGQGATTEGNRWAQQNSGEIGQGTLGLNNWQAQSNDQFRRAQANYGIGQDQTAQNLGMSQFSSYQPLQNMMTMQAMQAPMAY